MYGKHHTDKSNRKNSSSHKKLYKENPELKEKLRLNNLGRVQSKKERKMRSKAMLGKNKGKICSDSQKKNISNSLKSMHESPQKNWTLNQLAVTAGMSRSLYCREFKRYKN